MKRITALAFFVLLFPSAALSQSVNWSDQAGASTTDYQLGAGDLIEVRVFGIDAFEHTLRISSSLTITVPLLGAIPVNGMTPAQLEAEIYRRLSQNLIRDPQVSVFVKEHRARSVLVLGAVNAPGQYQVFQPVPLAEALSMAGGLDLAKASETAVVQRPSSNPNDPDPASERVVEVDLKRLLEEGDPSLNLLIFPGDVLNVLEKEVQLFYVIGEVNHPGAFEIPAHDGLVLSEALAWAGGPQRTAKMKEGLLVRHTESGERTELHLNFSKILKGEKQDIQVHPRDIVFIPGSTIKSIGYGLLGVIPGTISGAIVYGPLRR